MQDINKAEIIKLFGEKHLELYKKLVKELLQNNEK